MTQTYGFYQPLSNDSFLPIVKLNCQEGRVWRIDRSQTDSGSWDQKEVDITGTFRFVPDFTHLEVGFIRYADPGVDFQMQLFDAWVAAGRPRKAPEGYRFGFRVPILLTKECRREENDVRHLSHTSSGVLEAISREFAEYQKRAESGDLRLPLLALAIFEKRQRGQFKNFEPVFSAAPGWIQRPDIFDEKLILPEVQEAGSDGGDDEEARAIASAAHDF